MISWKNPTKKDDFSFEDYVIKGSLKAIEQVQKHSNSKKIHSIGYCLGGTLLSITNSYLRKKRLRPFVTNTYLTTLVDFENPGPIGAFLDENSISYIESLMEKEGLLDGEYLKFVFALLKSKEMIWYFYINNYLMGNEPPKFDILYWNSDSTNLSKKMHTYYLRNMYLENNLIKSNELKISDVHIDISKIDTPSYILATQDDHIAPWQSVFKFKNIVKGNNNRFILSESGHVAGVINPPNNTKYNYYINESNFSNASDFMEGATLHKGSWWNDWIKWMNNHSKDKKKITKNNNDYLYYAPGEYIFS